jgi:hypothetical protein
MQALPEHASEDRLCLLVRDPGCVFAYWEVSDQTRSEPGHSGSAWVLRLLFLHTGDVRDVPVDLEAGNYYAAVEPGTTLEAELGLYLPDGAYRVVVRGNPVSTPTPGISPVIDPEWYVSEAELLRLLGSLEFAAGSSPRGTERPEAEWVEPRWPLSPAVSSHDAQKKPRIP